MKSLKKKKKKKKKSWEREDQATAYLFPVLAGDHVGEDYFARQKVLLHLTESDSSSLVNNSLLKLFVGLVFGLLLKITKS